MSSLLRTEPNFHHPQRTPAQPYSAADDFYELLIEAHRDLSDEDSQALNARLILLLANHIGDLRILQEALNTAREAGG
jgi:hypothetical protein